MKNTIRSNLYKIRNNLYKIQNNLYKIRNNYFFDTSISKYFSLYLIKLNRVCMKTVLHTILYPLHFVRFAVHLYIRKNMFVSLWCIFHKSNKKKTKKNLVQNPKQSKQNEQDPKRSEKTMYKIQNNLSNLYKIWNYPKQPAQNPKQSVPTKSETSRNNLYKIWNNPKQSETTCTKSQTIYNNL